MAQPPLGSAEGWKYIRIAGIGAADVILGTAIAYTIQPIFTTPVKGDYVLPKDISNFVVLLLDTFFQAIFTLFLGIEVRNIIFPNPEGTSDPTGGILFVLSLFRQPNFWQKIDVLAGSIKNWIFSEFKSDDKKDLVQGVGMV